MNDALIDLEKGQGLLDYEFTGASCAFALHGEVDVWQVDRYGGTRRKGEFLHAMRSELHFEVSACVDTTLIVFKLEDLWASLRATSPWGPAEQRFAQLLGFSATRSALKTSAEIEAATYQAFPGARAVVLPGPYKADSVTQFNMPVLRSTDLEALLPPRVTWYPGMPFALFFVARFEGFGPAQKELAQYVKGGAAYHECGLMIPTRLGDSWDMRLFVPWIFPTSLMAMFAGREIYGYPKTWATIEVDETSLGSGRLLVRRNGMTLADVKYGKVPAVTTASNLASRLFAPAMTKLMPQALKRVKVACHKRLWNGIARDKAPDRWNPTYFSVDQIAESGFDVGAVKRVAPIQLEDHTIHLEVAQTDGTNPTCFDLQTFGGMATRVEYGIVMTTGGAPVDYIGPRTNLTEEERTRLAPIPLGVPPTLVELLGGWYGDWRTADDDPRNQR
ncbi:MAG: acetoacetate decarboxylase family protein [Proteobacteria bacterium]|nr:acetoacetate decarboxylase family protein [Pseudomonadota bacterium]